MAGTTVNIGLTFGALMLGGMFALLFCGVTQAQTFLYFKVYPKDRTFIKSLVLFIWMLDTLHSAFIIAALWDHFIDHFGDEARIDSVPWSLGLTIAITAVLTYSVHCFLIYRIFQLSRRNILLCTPLFIMACARLSFACLTTAKMVQLQSLAAFVEAFTWSFTAGLAISTTLDIFITISLVVLLRSRQQEFSRMNRVLDALVIYTFETGGITTVATGVCLITWITMADNLIFMALHFIISKFYANSLLITLNTRVDLKQASYHGASSTTNRHNLNTFPSSLSRGTNNTYPNVDGRELSSRPKHRSMTRTLLRFPTHLESQIRSQISAVHTMDGDRQRSDVSLDDLTESKDGLSSGLQIRVNVDKAIVVDQEVGYGSSSGRNAKKSRSSVVSRP